MKKHKTVKETKTESLIKNNTIKTMTEYLKNYTEEELMQMGRS